MADIHATAVEAEKCLEKLATELAQAGADEGTVKAVTQMADVARKIVVGLGKGQAATGDNQPPAPDAETSPAEQAAPPAEEAPEGEPAMPMSGSRPRNLGGY